MSPVAHFIQLLIGGIATGFVYALVGIGFVIIFKSTKVLNLAQGEFLMFGAYTMVTLRNLLGLPFLVALPLALILGYFFGVAVERAILKRMLGAPIFTIVMLTVGVSVVLRGIVGIIWGYDERTLTIPGFYNVIKFNIFSVNIGTPVVIVLSLLLVIGFGLFYRFTRTGTSMRATATDKQAAMVMGIDIARVSSVSWGLSALVSVFSGIVLASMTIVTPNLAKFGMQALPAVVLGGIDSVAGAVLGGVIVGLTENFAGGYIGGMAEQVFPYLILLAVLVIRPYGLLGTEEVERV